MLTKSNNTREREANQLSSRRMSVFGKCSKGTSPTPCINIAFCYQQQNNFPVKNLWAETEEVTRSTQMNVLVKFTFLSQIPVQYGFNYKNSSYQKLLLYASNHTIPIYAHLLKHQEIKHAMLLPWERKRCYSGNPKGISLNKVKCKPWQPGILKKVPELFLGGEKHLSYWTSNIWINQSINQQWISIFCVLEL